MRRIILILLLLPLAGESQHLTTNKYIPGPGEYQSELVDVTLKRWYNFIGKPTVYAGTPDSFVSVAGGAHHSCGLSVGGRVACVGDNGDGELGIGNNTSQTSPVFITQDSLGNVFTHVIKIMASGTIGWASFALKDDGTVWGWGDLQEGVRGNGTYGGSTTRPVQIPFPAGTFINDINIAQIGTALDSAGQVWTWGGSAVAGGSWTAALLAQGNSPTPFTPTKITIPGNVRIKMIAGQSGIPNYAIGVNNRVYGWSNFVWYLGCSPNDNMGNHGNRCFDITDSLSLPFPIDTLVTNTQASYAILTDSSLWAWGSNISGLMGNGPTIDMRHYVNLSGQYFPYGYDQGYGEGMQKKPVQVMVGKKNLTKVFGSAGYNYWVVVEDSHDSLIAWGRNKGNVLGNRNGGIDSINGDLQAYYANAWDVNYPTYINGFWSIPHDVRSGCPLCAPADSPTGHLCSTYPVSGSNPAPTANAGSNQTVSTSWTTLTGSKGYSGTTSGILNVLWTCTGKPAGAPNPIMPLQANDTINVSGLQPGSYTFQYYVRSSDFKTTTSSVNIQVGCSNCYIRQRSGRHKYINL